MPDSLETAALTGELFSGPRPHSPARSASTSSPINTDDELGSDLDDETSPITSSNPAPISIPSHAGPQTGPKGVIGDQKASERLKASQETINRSRILIDQERRKMSAMTLMEEEEKRKKDELKRIEKEKEDEEGRAKWRRERREELEALARARGGEEDIGIGGLSSSERGGLKEVGKEGFVLAVERKGWVVVLVYEPYIPRCHELLLSMLHLSLNLPPASSLTTPLHLLRARATSLAFSLLPPNASNTLISHDLNEDEIEDDFEDDTIANPVGQPDPDVLPTLLAYKDGELEKTWVRVDWEVSEDGVEGLLRREGILPSTNRLVFGQNDQRDEGEDDD